MLTLMDLPIPRSARDDTPHSPAPDGADSVAGGGVSGAGSGVAGQSHIFDCAA
jgi:hypothetical protein